LCRNLLSDTRLYEAFLKFDGELAAQAREARCPCGGPLHSANYERKPRGALVPLPAGYEERYSFCCGRDGCRQRVTPPSLRFLGRKVYLGVVVVVASMMRHGVTAARAATLRRAVGASRETVSRWRQWWTTLLPRTSFWTRARALFGTPVSLEQLPASLLARFEMSDDVGRVLKLLDFIKPVTTNSGAHLERISMGD
jgi:hypothetical protein